jgi:DNA polymerase III subunit beta
VKITAPGTFNAALSQAAMIADPKADTPVRVSADNGTISFTCVNPKTAISITATASATVIEPGQGAVSARRLAALQAGFGPGAMTLTISAQAMVITCGNSVYRLPLLPDPPAGLVIDPEIARMLMPTKDCLTLFEVLPAVGTERARFMLRGIYWHNVDGRLISVGADGTVLLRISVPADHLSSDCTLVIPAQAVTVLIRLLRQVKPSQLTMRRSHAAFGVSAPGFDFVTAMIGTPYPDYQRVVPAASNKIARCARRDLIGALARLDAVAGDLPLVALTWTESGPLRLFLPHQPDDASDIIAAETTGATKIALSLPRFAALISEFNCDRIHLEAADMGQGLMIRHGDKLGVLASCQWNFETEKRLALAR